MSGDFSNPAASFLLNEAPLGARRGNYLVAKPVIEAAAGTAKGSHCKGGMGISPHNAIFMSDTEY